VRLRQRSGSPIGRERLVWLGAAALARLRMLGFHGQEMRDERSVRVIGMPLRRAGNRIDRNKRTAFIG